MEDCLSRKEEAQAVRVEERKIRSDLRELGGTPEQGSKTGLQLHQEDGEESLSLPQPPSFRAAQLCPGL